MPVYLDFAATTPLDPEVRKIMLHYFDVEYGNAGSRTHIFGQNANAAVSKARGQIAEVVQATSDEVIFTSGATESNNLAILGLEKFGLESKKTHIVSTEIEHKAVLEPLEEMSRRGFEVTLVPPESDGRVCAEKFIAAIRPDTLLVSMMHANNETGTLQPIEAVAKYLKGHEAYYHVDAAQSFGKVIEPLQDHRIDFISVSGHKIYGPKGIGCLITRKRKFKRLPLRPLIFGGGQERGLRPGTLPVPLIAGFGKAAELAYNQVKIRLQKCLEVRSAALTRLQPLDIIINGNENFVLPTILNISIPYVDSEAAIVSLKGIAAVSNGSACTSAYYAPSHVLNAMKLNETRITSAIRLSFSHFNEQIDWTKIRNGISLVSRLQ